MPKLIPNMTRKQPAASRTVGVAGICQHGVLALQCGRPQIHDNKLRCPMVDCYVYLRKPLPPFPYPSHLSIHISKYTLRPGFTISPPTLAPLTPHPLSPPHASTTPLIYRPPPFPPPLRPGFWSTPARPQPAHPPADPSCVPLPPGPPRTHACILPYVYPALLTPPFHHRMDTHSRHRCG